MNIIWRLKRKQIYHSVLMILLVRATMTGSVSRILKFDVIFSGY